MDLLAIDEVKKLFEVVIDPLVRLLFAAAIVYFTYGVFTYIRRSADSDGRIEGANHILWSTIGIFIMISVWGIISILENTVG